MRAARILARRQRSRAPTEDRCRTRPNRQQLAGLTPHPIDAFFTSVTVDAIARSGFRSERCPRSRCCARRFDAACHKRRRFLEDRGVGRHVSSFAQLKRLEGLLAPVRAQPCTSLPIFRPGSRPDPWSDWSRYDGDRSQRTDRYADDAIRLSLRRRRFRWRAGRQEPSRRQGREPRWKWPAIGLPVPPWLHHLHARSAPAIL